MSDPAASVPARRRRRVPIGLVAVAAFSLATVVAALWGWLAVDPQLRVFTFDAGAVDRFEIGRVVPFEELDLYVVGLADGRIRAVDGIVRGNGCAVRWLPDDQRALSVNPRAAAGAFEDPCTGTLWAITGDAVAGTLDPLRSFLVTYRTDAAGVQHVEVEVLGRAPPASPGPD